MLSPCQCHEPASSSSCPEAVPCKQHRDKPQRQGTFPSQDSTATRAESPPKSPSSRKNKPLCFSTKTKAVSDLGKHFSLSNTD